MSCAQSFRESILPESGLKLWFLVFSCREKMSARVVRWNVTVFSLNWLSEINLRISYVWHILLAHRCGFSSFVFLANIIDLSSECSRMPVPLVPKTLITFRNWKSKYVTCHCTSIYTHTKKAHLTYQNLFIAKVCLCFVVLI